MKPPVQRRLTIGYARREVGAGHKLCAFSIPQRFAHPTGRFLRYGIANRRLSHRITQFLIAADGHPRARDYARGSVLSAADCRLRCEPVDVLFALMITPR